MGWKIKMGQDSNAPQPQHFSLKLWDLIILCCVSYNTKVDYILLFQENL